MIIKQDHLIESIHSALQYISYYHSPDFINAMVSAYQRETNQSAKNAIEQILINSKMCALGKRPICQDTGIVNVFVEVGMNIEWESDLSLEDMINEGVRRAYTSLIIASEHQLLVTLCSLEVILKITHLQLSILS